MAVRSEMNILHYPQLDTVLMVEETIKIIPSKGTRLKIMVVLEVLAILWAMLLFLKAPELSETFTYDLMVATQLSIFVTWSEFTIWNVGTYAASETVVKSAEGYMNK